VTVSYSPAMVTDRSAAAVGEVLAERLVFDRVPAEADPEPEVPVREQVHLRGLLGDQRRLPLREDDDASDEFERDHGGQVPEHDQRLVERRVDVVRPGPRLVHDRIGAEHVVVGQDVGKAKLLDPRSVGADGTAIGADLGLREHYADIHECLSTMVASTPLKPVPRNDHAGWMGATIVLPGSWDR
jgi:hypothetical protein